MVRLQTWQRLALYMLTVVILGAAGGVGGYAGLARWHAKHAPSQRTGATPSTWLDPLLNKGISANLVPVATRPTLNFSGAGFSVADDPSNGVTTVTNTAGTSPPVFFSTLATLPCTTRATQILDGYASTADNGGGTFVCAPSSVAAVDGCNISAALATGRWIRVFDGHRFSVRNCGAQGNGIADDTASIGLTVTAAAAVGGTVVFPPGVYLTTGIKISDQMVNLEGAGNPAGSALVNVAVLKSVTNQPIVQYTSLAQQATTTATSATVTVTDASKWAVNDLLAVNNNAPALTGCAGGCTNNFNPASGYAGITWGGGANKVQTKVNSINLGLNQLTVADVANTSVTSAAIRRVNWPSVGASIKNLLLQGGTVSIKTTAPLLTDQDNGRHTSATFGTVPATWYPGMFFVARGAGPLWQGIQYDLEAMITAISGNTITYTPGASTALTADIYAQSGLLVDNNGFLTVENVWTNQTNGTGFSLKGATASKFIECGAQYATLDAVSTDDTVTGAFNTNAQEVSFFDFNALAPDRDGFRGISGTQGVNMVRSHFHAVGQAPRVSTNAYSINLLHGGGTYHKSNWNRFFGTWEEKASGFIAATASANVDVGFGNILEFSRFENAAPSGAGLAFTKVIGLPVGSATFGDMAAGAQAYLSDQLLNPSVNVARATLVASAAPIIDFSGNAVVSNQSGNGGILQLTITGNITGATTFTGLRDGAFWWLEVIEGGGGGFTFNWPSNVVFPLGSTPVPSNTYGLPAGDSVWVGGYYDATLHQFDVLFNTYQNTFGDCTGTNCIRIFNRTGPDGSMTFKTGTNGFSFDAPIGFIGGTNPLSWQFANLNPATTTGNYTLSSSEYSTPQLVYSTTLTGDVTIIFPNVPGFWHVVVGGMTLAGHNLFFKSGSATSAAVSTIVAGKDVVDVYTRGSNSISIHY